MIVKNESLSPKEKVALFRKRFSGLQRAYGTYDVESNQSSVIKEPVTYQVIFDHLKGKRPFGIFLLKEDRIHTLAVDFDSHDREPVIQFVSRTEHYNIPSYVEISKSKGFHVWIFFDDKGVLAAKARLVVNQILQEIDLPHTEVFPKQDSIDTSAQYGNFINAPFFGALAPLGKTIFVDLNNDFQPYSDQWEFLQNVQLVTEQEIDNLIEVNEWTRSDKIVENSTPISPFPSYPLPPCARRILDEGVTENQRSACFRIAVQLKRVGLPFDLAMVVLKVWAMKNRPIQDKRIITDDEIISQTKYAYQNDYRGYGCEDPAIQPFCDPNCPVKNRPEFTQFNPKGGETA